MVTAGSLTSLIRKLDRVGKLPCPNPDLHYGYYKVGQANACVLRDERRKLTRYSKP
jgi:hypothetical protein